VTKGKPLDLRITGDPGSASAALRPLAALLERLLRFDHPSLRPYVEASFALLAREATHPGGCRLWTLTATPAEAASGTVVAGSSVSSGFSPHVRVRGRQHSCDPTLVPQAP
jgi:hypothetical protein